MKSIRQIRFCAILFLSFPLFLGAQNNNSTHVSGSGQINVNGPYAPGATIIYNDPSNASKNSNSNLSPSGIPECQRNQSGDITFENKTQNIFVITISRNGIFQKEARISPGEAGNFYDLSGSGWSYVATNPSYPGSYPIKEGEFRIDACKTKTVILNPTPPTEYEKWLRGN